MAEVTGKQKWNFAAAISAIAILSMNIVAGLAVYTGKITMQDYLAAVGPTNALILGWVGRMLSAPVSPPA